MKKLEKKIIQNVFFYETRQTIFLLLLRIFAIIAFAIGGIFLTIYVLSQLAVQQTLDIFEILFEDVEILRRYSGEIVNTFLVELPKLEIFFSLTAFALSFMLLFALFKNFPRVKNKIYCLVKYWFNLFKPDSAQSSLTR